MLDRLLSAALGDEPHAASYLLSDLARDAAVKAAVVAILESEGRGAHVAPTQQSLAIAFMQSLQGMEGFERAGMSLRLR